MVFRTVHNSEKQFHITCFNTLADTTTNILRFEKSNFNINPSFNMINYENTIWSIGTRVYSGGCKFSI